MTKSNAKGFTLIELLVVIAIIGVLAAVVLLAINPAEMLRRSRDTQRLSDMVTLRKAIDAVIASGSATLPLGTTAGTCAFATPCKGTNISTRTVVGAGWLPMNLAGFLSTLPVEPSAATYRSANGTNSAGTTPGYYFGTNGADYRLATYLESVSNATKLTSDGGPATGDSVNLFETGTDLTTAITAN